MFCVRRVFWKNTRGIRKTERGTHSKEWVAGLKFLITLLFETLRHDFCGAKISYGHKKNFWRKIFTCGRIPPSPQNKVVFLDGFFCGEEWLNCFSHVGRLVNRVGRLFEKLFLIFETLLWRKNGKGILFRWLSTITYWVGKESPSPPLKKLCFTDPYKNKRVPC